MQYCQDSRIAKVAWRFADRLGSSEHYATPIDVSVFGVPNPAINTPAQAVNGFDFGLITVDNYSFTFTNLNPDFVYWFEYFDVVSIESLTVRAEPFYPVGNNRIVLPERLYVRNDNTIEMRRRPLATYQRLTSLIYSQPATIWQLEVTDSLGRKITDKGAVKPIYTVNCGGCPPGTIDCGGCCLPCETVNQKLRAIDVQL